MKELMKNISKSEVLTLRDQVLCQPGQVVSKTLAQNEHNALRFRQGRGDKHPRLRRRRICHLPRGSRKNNDRRR